MNKIQAEVAEESCVSQKIVEAIAEAEETEPIELTPPLYEVIDPEALENLFANNQTLGKVVFNYNSCEVTVFSDGYISVKKACI
ncbi:HalOD1 output domain-containing protein [Natrononativus amylolyticus]|uniref:HalOD1 output domain-containing protein n=1 Tax=Natrononativus amylolyticus TaxID=2963434 RepID=UPI0020CF25AB|nr:HalOD1 output domain-containing protein [Natrononativus amylolyticus]